MSQVGIYRDGKSHELPLTRPLAMAGTRVMSWTAKLRMVRLVIDIALARMRGQLDYVNMSKAATLDPTAPVQFASDFMSAAGQNAVVELGNRAAVRLCRF